MNYTVQELATLADISVRTLHYYDEIHLLSPKRQGNNDYRVYDDNDLLMLQQILFFRELEFPLEKIKEIITKPSFDIKAALKDQRHMLELKQKRLMELLKTVDSTMQSLEEKTVPDGEGLFEGFTKEEAAAYAKEAQERWGHTDAWKQSRERTKHWTKADYDRIGKEGIQWTKKLGDMFASGLTPDSDDIQEMVRQHYEGLRTFYEPNEEMYRGLADMYVDDPRFTKYYDKHRPGLAAFFRKAMHAYCDRRPS